MGDGNDKKNGTEKETTDSVSNESYDLFARLLIQRIVGFLKERPSDFAITILPPLSEPILEEDAKAVAGEDAAGEESVQKMAGDSFSSTSLESLSVEHRSLLETSTVLMYDPKDTCKSSCHFGLEARKLPLIARILRKAYRQAKNKLQNASLPSLSAAEKEELLHVTSCLLLIQPDHVTAWADRRRCLLSLQQSPNLSTIDFPGDDQQEDEDQEEDRNETSSCLWSKELDYLDILVTQHSKAPSSWAHRKYVLQRILNGVEASYQNHGDLERTNKTKDIFFAREVKTCIDVAEKFPKNYYAWTHRRYLWDLFSFESSGLPKFTSALLGLKTPTNKDLLKTVKQQRERYIQLLETELMIGMWQEWLPKHPADHSAVHYSCQVLDLLLRGMISVRLDTSSFKQQADQDEKLRSVCSSALEQVRTLLSKFSHQNESLWILRRMTYKILWKYMFVPSKTSEMAASVCRLVRNDLRSTVSSTLNVYIQYRQGDDHKDGENDSAEVRNPTSIHAWTLIAWCIANLDGIDDNRSGIVDNSNAFANDIIFTPTIREIASRYLKSQRTDMAHHNNLVYTSSSSPLSKMLASGATKS